MKKTVELELNRKNVETAIKEFVLKKHGLKIKKIRFSIGSKGDHDHGDLEEFVETVYCECELPKK